MGEIRFAHLSDTHVRVDHSESSLNLVFRQLRKPNDNLKDVLNELKALKLDFIIISGDLVHEGDKEDYECLKKILEESTKDIPVFLALGNHDRKDAFRAVFSNENSDSTSSRFYYSAEIEGLRIIVLDSSAPDSGMGSVDNVQLEWLEKKLGKPGDKGSIIVMHHPVAWPDNLLAVKRSDRLLKILRASDVIGIFCGHTHDNRVVLSQGILQIVSESLAFGFDYDENTASISDRCSYNICTVDENGLSVHYKNFRAKTKIVADMPRTVLQAILA